MPRPCLYLILSLHIMTAFEQKERDYLEVDAEVDAEVEAKAKAEAEAETQIPKLSNLWFVNIGSSSLVPGEVPEGPPTLGVTAATR